MVPLNGWVLVLFGLLVVHGRPDEGIRLTNSNGLTSSTGSDLVKKSYGGLDGVANDATFCIENNLEEVTILLKATYTAGGQAGDGSTTAKSGATACLAVPDQAEDITFDIYVNDHNPPIFIFEVSFPNISKMENSCLKYKVTHNGYYPDCVSYS